MTEPVYELKATVESETIAATTRTLRTNGYAVDGDLGGAIYVRVAAQPTHAGKVRSVDRFLPNGSTDAANGGWWELVAPTVTSAMFGGNLLDMVKFAYLKGANVILAAGQSIGLPCNPTAGDDFPAMCRWAAGDHFKPEGAELWVEVQDGYHEVNGYVDITHGRDLDVRATSAPDSISIAQITIASVGSGLYGATVTLTTPLPSRVVPGFALGFQNVRSPANNGASALNGAHIPIIINSADRRIFTINFQTSGVLPNSPGTSIDTSLDATIGLDSSRVLVPKASLNLNPAGWDGGAREGFMNALQGGRINLSYLGFAYQGAYDDHDILFARDRGSIVNLLDQVVICGTGDKVLRAGPGGSFFVNRSCLSAGTMGGEIFQGVADSSLYMARCSMGSAKVGLLTATAATTIFVTRCLLASSPVGLRPTYPSSSITMSVSRLSHLNIGLYPTRGHIWTEDATTINRCTSPISITGGFLYGSPTITNSTNAPPAANVENNYGGGWYKTVAPLA